MTLKIKKLSEKAILPERKTEYSVGYDLCVVEDYSFDERPVTQYCKTDIAIELEGEGSEQYAIMLYARSSLSKTGLILANCVGVIDPDYRGEIRIALINISGSRQELKAGQRVAQLVIQKICTPEVVEVKELSDTERGIGAFGSTGI